MNNQELIRFQRAILLRAWTNLAEKDNYVVFMKCDGEEAPVFVTAQFTLRREDVEALRAEFGPEAI